MWLRIFFAPTRHAEMSRNSLWLQKLYGYHVLVVCSVPRQSVQLAVDTPRAAKLADGSRNFDTEFVSGSYASVSSRHGEVTNDSNRTRSGYFPIRLMNRRMRTVYVFMQIQLNNATRWKQISQRTSQLAKTVELEEIFNIPEPVRECPDGLRTCGTSPRHSESPSNSE